jgi:Tfp pilus assembly protein PilF
VTVKLLIEGGLIFCLSFVFSFAQIEFRPLRLSGKVEMADGSALPEPARIELVCSGQIQPQAYTRDDGTFNFEVGGDQAQRVNARDADRNLPSARVGARGEDRSHVSLTGCEVRAVLPGHHSTLVKLGRRSVFESPDIGVLILSPFDQSVGYFASPTTLKAPREARKAFEKAGKEAAKKNPNLKKALAELVKAVAAHPEFADAWNLKGEVHARAGELTEAEHCFQKAIEADSQLVPPYLSLALIELQRNQPTETIKFTERVLRLMPASGEAHYYNGLAEAALGNLETARESLISVAYSTDVARFPRSLYVLGNIHAQAAAFDLAAKEYRRYLDLEPDSKAAELVRAQLEEWKAKGVIEK